MLGVEPSSQTVHEVSGLFPENAKGMFTSGIQPLWGPKVAQCWVKFIQKLKQYGSGAQKYLLN
jgi:hypothetical protein